MKLIRTAFLLLLLFSSCSFHKNRQQGFYRFWPEQKKATELIICTYSDEKEHILAQSLAGLASRATNESGYKTLIWIENNGDSYQHWLKDQIRRGDYRKVYERNVWEVLNQLKKKGIVKGFVSYDLPKKGSTETNISLNIATVLAGQLDAVLIERELEERAEQFLLRRLDEGTKYSYLEVFEKYKDKLNRKLVLTINPRVPNMRDVAISQKTMVFCGGGHISDVIYGWLERFTPILGWNSCGGSEYEFTVKPTNYGHFNTASDWANNIPVLSQQRPLKKELKIKSVDPVSIDYSKNGHFISFLMSDGDNVQWTLGNFFHSEKYWHSKYHGEFPMGWTSCMVHLSQMAPDVLDYEINSQPSSSSLVEFGGGYFYPDKFGDKLKDENALREFAKRINPYLKARGVKLFHFICEDVNSPKSLKAYQIFAEELESIEALLPIQYSGYEQGYGEIHWVKNAKGIHIPAITAKYCLWKGRDKDRNAGSPVKIANDVKNAQIVGSNSSFEWVSVHAWSNFIAAEMNSPVEGTGGLSAVKACIDNLPVNVNVVTLEELAWRLRMNKYPEETRKQLNELSGKIKFEL